MPVAARRDWLVQTMAVPANLGSHVGLLGALTMIAGVAMSRLGLGTGMLRLRRPERRCPACGRLTQRRVCLWCRERLEG